ncbi:MAG: DUF222 domain-containing protein [Acidimicrobiales bacterium]
MGVPDVCAVADVALLAGPAPPMRRSASPAPLEHLPIVAAAFERGELSYSKVRAITRVAYPAIEQGLVDTAKSIHTAGLERIVAGIRRARVLNNPDRPDLEPGMRRFVRSRSHEDGTVTLTVRLPAEEHAVLVKAIDAVAEPDKHADIEQRRADALLEVAARALAATGTATSTADRYQVVVRVDADVLTGDNPTGECHVDGGDAISAETARRLCCDGSVIRSTRTSTASRWRSARRPERCRRRCGGRCTPATAPAASGLHASGMARRPPPTPLDRRRTHQPRQPPPTLPTPPPHRPRRRLDRAPQQQQRRLDVHQPQRLEPTAATHHRTPRHRTRPTENLDPHAVRPYWIDRPHYPYIISVFADPPPPDPQWN